jgi:hypothetical protein
MMDRGCYSVQKAVAPQAASLIELFEKYHGVALKTCTQDGRAEFGEYWITTPILRETPHICGYEQHRIFRKSNGSDSSWTDIEAESDVRPEPRRLVPPQTTPVAPIRYFAESDAECPSADEATYVRVYDVSADEFLGIMRGWRQISESDRNFDAAMTDVDADFGTIASLRFLSKAPKFGDVRRYRRNWLRLWDRRFAITIAGNLAGEFFEIALRLTKDGTVIESVHQLIS